jgi:hypothetical protein
VQLIRKSPGSFCLCAPWWEQVLTAFKSCPSNLNRRFRSRWNHVAHNPIVALDMFSMARQGAALFSDLASPPMVCRFLFQGSTWYPLFIFWLKLPWVLYGSMTKYIVDSRSNSNATTARCVFYRKVTTICFLLYAAFNTYWCRGQAMTHFGKKYSIQHLWFRNSPSSCITSMDF